MLQKEEINRQLLSNPITAKNNNFSFGLFCERAAFYGLLIVILLTAIPYGTVDPWFKLIFVSFACVAAVFRIIEAIVNDSILFADFRLFAPLLGILLLAVIQIFPFGTSHSVFDTLSYTSNCISLDPYETKIFILTFTGLLLTGEILFRYTTTKRRLLALIYLVLSIGIASALFGFIRQLFQSEKIFLPATSGYAQFVNINHFVFLMEMTLGLLLGLLIKGKLSRGLKLIFWVMTGIVCFSVISANSRGGILSTVGLSVFAIFAYFLTKNSYASNHKNKKTRTL